MSTINNTSTQANNLVYNNLVAYFLGCGATIISSDNNITRFKFPGNSSSDNWLQATNKALSIFDKQWYSANYWRIIETKDGTNLVVKNTKLN